MKKNLLFLFLTFMTLGFVACDDDNNGNELPGGDAISIVWETNPDFDTVEIMPNREVDALIAINAEAGINTLRLQIESPVLTDVVLGAVGLSTDVELTTLELDESMAAILAGVPFGEQVKNKTAVEFNVSSLVPLIMNFEGAVGYHVFSVTVTDNKGNAADCSLVFHYSGENAPIQTGDLKFADADLWANSVKATLENATETMVLQYRRVGAETWQEVAYKDGAFLMETEWTSGKNDAGLDILTPNTEKGVWAGVDYEYQVMDGDTKVTEGIYRPEGGDAIPNGDMSGWSTKEGTLPYPNAEPDTVATGFWDSGNNSLSMTFGVTLCQQDSTDAGVAYLKAGMVLGSVFAPGNMFTGDFAMGTFGQGVVSFGKSYEWTARPKALKVRLKANVGKIDKIGSSDKENAGLEGQQDKIPVFAAVVDWTKQHGVTSGLGTPSGMWHPAQTNKLEEGAILGYASHYVEESLADYTEIEIPFEWYDNTTKPSSEFTLVISCATSYRGDYLTGCSTNQLWIDSFEWVY